MTEHRIIFGDSRSLNEIKDKSVQLIITSPPYWQLKDYGTEDQIGFNDSYEEYIFDISSEMLPQYHLGWEVWTCPGAMHGNWRVTVPLAEEQAQASGE